MRVGIAIEETWDFFHEVYAELAEHHQTRLYQRPRALPIPIVGGRLDTYRHRRDLQAFLRGNDVVFFEWASGLLASATHMKKACTIVTRLHRYEMYQWADRINWEAVDRLILVSQAKLQEFTLRFPQHAHKAVVIPEAVSVDRFTLASRQYSGQIGILGHLRPRKRVYELILAFHELTQRRPEFHLHIGGGPAPGAAEYHDALVQLVRRLDLGGKVTFHGHVAKPEAWYPSIDIFVSNGYSEGLQVSPMEAMACGCHCVSHRWDGADELLPPANLYDTNTQLNELILRYADLSASEKIQDRARMRAAVCDRFNVNVTKVDIRRVIEDAGAVVGDVEAIPRVSPQRRIGVVE